MSTASTASNGGPATSKMSRQSGGQLGDYAELEGMFTVHETIGTGNYAKVKRAEHTLTKDWCAIKIVDKSRLSERDLELVMSEVEALSELESRHVVRLYMVIETDARLCLALEYGEGGDLYEHVSSMGPLPPSRTRVIFKQIVLALSHCHTLGYAHRDLKAENVVFTDAYASIVKLTDFGFSVKDSDDKMLSTMCGSLMYSAPEILLAEPYKGKLADLWSLGILLYFMVSGNLPFDDSSEATAVTKVMDLDYQPPQEASDDCINLISRLLVRDPEGRASLETVLAHRFMTSSNGEDKAELDEPLPPSEAQPKKGSLVKPLSESDPQLSRLSPLKKKATLVPRRLSKIKASAKRKVLDGMGSQGFDPAEVEISIQEHKRDYNSCTFFLLLEQEERDNRNSGRTAGSFRTKKGLSAPSLDVSVEEASTTIANAEAEAADTPAAEGAAAEPPVEVIAEGKVDPDDAAGTAPTDEDNTAAKESTKERKLRLKNERATVKQEAKLAKQLGKEQAKNKKEADKLEAKMVKAEAKRVKILAKMQKKKKGSNTAEPAAPAEFTTEEPGAAPASPSNGEEVTFAKFDTPENGKTE
eukprot:m.118429 g.118429  ORF g.118429 m.118429 type:complete len:586 (+) comp21727_c0_seq1:78-1835(+)